MTRTDRGSIRYHRGGWELTLWSDGKRIIRRHRAPNNRNGRRSAEDALEQLIHAVAADVEGRTVADVLDGYAVAKGKGWAPSTRASHRAHRGPIIKAFGDTPVEDLTAQAIETTYEEWLDDGLAPGTIHRRHDILSAAMIRAERLGIIRHSPTRHVELPKKPDTPPIELPAMTTVFGALSGLESPEWLRVAAHLTVATGMRRGELCALRWSEVDLDSGTLSITRGASVDDDGTVVVKGTKQKRRYANITIDDGTVTVLTTWHATCVKHAARLGVIHNDDWPVIGRRTNPAEVMVPDRITRAWIRNRDAIGLTNVRWHDLRHVVGSELIAAGIDPVTVAARLGHDPAMLLERYAHARPAGDQAAADVIAAALTNAAKSKKTDGHGPKAA